MEHYKSARELFMEKTSEEKLNIIDPYEYQCASIDEMIVKSNVATNFCTAALSALDQQTIVQANKEVLLRISNFEEQLEEFRTAIEHTRRWGNEWKSKAKELINKHDPSLLTMVDEDPDIPF